MCNMIFDFYAVFKTRLLPPCCRLKFASLLSALSSSSSSPTPLCYLLPIPTLFGCIIPFYNQLLVILHFSAFSSPFNPHPSSFCAHSLCSEIFWSGDFHMKAEDICEGGRMGEEKAEKCKITSNWL